MDSTSVKTPAFPKDGPRLFDLPDINSKSEVNALLATVLARWAMQSVQANESQAQFWQEHVQCTEPLLRKGNSWVCPSTITFSNVASLKPPYGPFMVQLPANYSTGLLLQYAPRVNISTTYERISATEISNCESQPHALSLNFSKNSVDPPTVTDWGLQACMPGSLETPWKATRARQDFSEVLFLNVTYPDLTGRSLGGLVSEYTKVIMNPTAGYFELPNIMDDQVSGALLRDGPPQKPSNPWERQVTKGSFGPG